MTRTSPPARRPTAHRRAARPGAALWAAGKHVETVTLPSYQSLSESWEKLDTPRGRITIQNAKFPRFTPRIAVQRLSPTLLLDNPGNAHAARADRAARSRDNE